MGALWVRGSGGIVKITPPTSHHIPDGRGRRYWKWFNRYNSAADLPILLTFRD